MAASRSAEKLKPVSFKSWSFSRWNEYEECPLRASLKHLHRIPEGEKGPALVRGQDVATRTEHWLAKATRKMPEELTPLKGEYEKLRKTPNLKLELMHGFDKGWKPVRWDDWDKCWLRVKMDVSFLSKDGLIYTTIDNKTGKFRTWQNEKYLQQLDLYAVAGAVQHPTAETIKVSLYYSDEGIVFPDTNGGAKIYSRDEALAQIPVWNKRVRAMFADTRFAPRPGEHCRYCPYSRNKSGHCKF